MPSARPILEFATGLSYLSIRPGHISFTWLSSFYAMLSTNSVRYLVAITFFLLLVVPAFGQEDTSITETLTRLNNETASISELERRLMHLNIDRAYSENQRYKTYPIVYDDEEKVFRTVLMLSEDSDLQDVSAESKIARFRTQALGLLTDIGGIVLSDVRDVEMSMLKIHFIKHRSGGAKPTVVGRFEDGEVQLVHEQVNTERLFPLIHFSGK